METIFRMIDECNFYRTFHFECWKSYDFVRVAEDWLEPTNQTQGQLTYLLNDVRFVLKIKFIKIP